MLENLRRGRQARNITINVPKILDLKSSSEQIFSKNWRWVPLIAWDSFYDITVCCPAKFRTALFTLAGWDILDKCFDSSQNKLPVRRKVTAILYDSWRYATTPWCQIRFHHARRYHALDVLVVTKGNPSSKYEHREHRHCCVTFEI